MNDRQILVAVVIALCGVQSAHAQNLAGWRWQLDRDARRVNTQAVPDTSFRFDQMPPGWHITTGPGALLYHPAERADGRYSLVGDFVVFPETSDSGFGIFLGGSDLDTDSASWLSAQLRRDGAVRVIHRKGTSEHVLAPWSVHSVIKPHTGSGVVTNRMRVGVTADTLRVFVNDSAVARVGIAGMRTSGHFGFRIGEKVNLHLTILDYIRHLAPARN
jgi:hypothetical protein